VAGRRVTFLALLGSLAAVAALPATAADARRAHATQISITDDPTLELGVFSDLNRIRRAHQLVPLTLSSSLHTAATQHTVEMLDRGYFAHDSADGQSFWKRIEEFYPDDRARYWSVGENLFWSSGEASAAEGTAAWMASPPHRANILNPAWRQIGIAAVTSPDAPGTFAGRGVTVITTDFGVRR
jgi:uncharacterized protein YkwD